MSLVDLHCSSLTLMMFFFWIMLQFRADVGYTDDVSDIPFCLEDGDSNNLRNVGSMVNTKNIG